MGMMEQKNMFQRSGKSAKTHTTTSSYFETKLTQMVLSKKKMGFFYDVPVLKGGHQPFSHVFGSTCDALVSSCDVTWPHLSPGVIFGEQEGMEKKKRAMMQNARRCRSSKWQWNLRMARGMQ